MTDIRELYSQAHAKFDEKKFDEALKLIDEMKRLEPNFKGAYLFEVFVFYTLDEYRKVTDVLKKFLPRYNLSSPEEKEEAATALRLLASSYAYLGISEEAIKVFKLSAQMTLDDNKGFNIYSDAIFVANSLENFSALDFRVLYAGINKYLSYIVPYPKELYSHEKIRVGFLSANFCNHTLMKWSLPLLTNLDKNFFEPYFYSSTRKGDFVTEALQEAAEAWRDISNLKDEAAAKLIHDDEIDILFELDGHTPDNRLRVAAYRPATVQMSGIGYMNSTGLDCFDYFLSDETCAGDESYFTEKVIKLRHSHVCYEPMTELEPASFPPCLKNNFVTFGSFNHAGKITDSMLTVWKKILDFVPDSRLILKDKLFNSDDGRNFFTDKLKGFGFDINRVEMRPFTKSWLSEYGDVDIALDTFPYTGGVTTCDALYMGVPVVSLYGDRHGSRFGLSILKNVGLEELAVDSYDEYIKRALMLASDWDLLTLL